MGPFSDFSTPALLTILGVMLFVFFYIIYLAWSRRKKPDVSVMTINELKGLKQKKLLTDEELAKVRESMARQYLEYQSEEERRRQPLSQKPMEMLSLELEKEEMRLAKEGKKKQTPAPVEKSEQSPLVSSDPPQVPQPVPVESGLPERLRPYLDKAETELEDLMHAGFMSDEDFELLIQEKQNQA